MDCFRASVRALQILGRARLDDALGTRWALLHSAGLNMLRQHHPRHLADEWIEERINWSAVLDLSATGLRKLPLIALHADTWAAEAARQTETFQNFRSWYGFIGTPEHLLLDEHIHTGALAIRTANNSLLTSYQLHCELMESDTAAAFNAALRAAGCSFKPITQQFFTELLGEFQKYNAA
ncbi:MAG: hypothetical protein RL189_714 [Pseudomonadota bacterium]|jgi:hypothetical protein